MRAVVAVEAIATSLDDEMLFQIINFLIYDPERSELLSGSLSTSYGLASSMA